MQHNFSNISTYMEIVEIQKMKMMEMTGTETE